MATPQKLKTYCTFVGQKRNKRFVEDKRNLITMLNNQREKNSKSKFFNIYIFIFISLNVLSGWNFEIK